MTRSDHLHAWTRAALAALCLGYGGGAIAQDGDAERGNPPAAIMGRWAVDPADCVGNRYVWRFARDRVSLLVDNAPATRAYRASWQANDESVTLTFKTDANASAVYVFRLLNERQLAVSRVVVRGVEQDLKRETRWSKCD